MDQLGLNLGYILVQILNFAIVAVVLYAWVYRPLTGMLQRRRESIAQGLEDAKVAADARANAEQEAERIIKDAQVRANEIVREATERAEGANRELRTQAEAEIAQARENALSQVEAERNQMLSGLRSQVVSLAMSAARKLIGDTLSGNETHQRTLIQEFFTGIQDGKLQLLRQGQISGNRAEVTSALPLDNSEKQMVQRELERLAGGTVEVDFRVDPEILGGLVIRVGDQVIDGSVSGQLRELHQSL